MNKEQILKNISLKRKYRYEKKLELLNNNNNRKEILKKEIKIQTDKIKKKINLDIDIFDIVNIEPEKKYYKSKYFGRMLGLNDININETNIYKKNHLNKINDIIEYSIIREKEILILNEEKIILKVIIDSQNKKIIVKLNEENIEKIFEYKRNTKFTLIKNNNNSTIKINDEIIFIFKKTILYYYIK